MTQEILEMIKESVEERKKKVEEEEIEEEIKVKQIYTDIWKNVLNQYKNNINMNIYGIDFYEYLKQVERLSQNGKILLKEKLNEDGFKLYPMFNVMGIRKELIENFINSDDKREKNENKQDKPTPKKR